MYSRVTLLSSSVLTLVQFGHDVYSLSSTYYFVGIYIYLRELVSESMVISKTLVFIMFV